MIYSTSLQRCVEAGEWWLQPGTLFDGSSLSSGRALRLSGERIVSIVPAGEVGSDGAPVFRTPCLACPGFFDIQINGGGGVLFNTTPTRKGLEVIGATHRKTGTTSFLPTLITDAPETMERAADAVIGCLGTNSVAGIHLEGPHISVERKGAHKAEFVRPIDEHTFTLVERLRAADVPVLLTLAPECIPAGSIARLRAAGAVVSLGHTAADARTTREAIAEGARCATHLYNAMTPITSREPGVVGAVLDSSIYCSFIADGHHVDESVLRLAIRSRRHRDRMVLISDAMPTWGGPDQYELYGEVIRLSDGRLINASGSLAGVHIDMASSVKRLVDDIGLPVDEALGMATRSPAALMGLQGTIGMLHPGSRADIVLLDLDLRPSLVMVDGRPVDDRYSRDRHHFSATSRGLQ